MTITIQNTTLIHPSTPPPTQTLSLSSLDTDPNLHVTIRYLRAYVTTTTLKPTNIVHVISSALSKTLTHYYPLSGTLRKNAVNNNRLELTCDVDDSVPLITATCDITLASLNHLDDPDQDLVEKLVPDPDLQNGLVNPFLLQITVFKCGGYTIGACVFHALCDGLGATMFFNTMAEYAQGVVRASIEPVWDRVRLLGPRDPVRVEVSFDWLLGLDKEVELYGVKSSSVVKGYFCVKDECLDRFKEELFEESGSRFTTFEALGAYIWRAKVKSSGIPSDEIVKFAYSISIRKLVNPPLPNGYWGNGCVPMYIQLSVKQLLENPIWKTAELINKSKVNANDEYVRSFIDFQELNYGKGITAGNQVSGFTDWRHLGHSTVDFGHGGPVTLLPLSRHLLGSVEPCFFLPYSSANAGKKDGFKVLVSLPESAMPAFKQEMEKFTC